MRREKNKVKNENKNLQLFIYVIHKRKFLYTRRKLKTITRRYTYGWRFFENKNNLKTSSKPEVDKTQYCLFLQDLF